MIIGDKAKVKFIPGKKDIFYGGGEIALGVEVVIVRIGGRECSVKPITHWKNGSVSTYSVLIDELEPLNLTPEQKSERLKNESKEFVNQYIKNPKQSDYQRFEAAFLKGDNFGM